jgi:hypothetical protein
METTISGARKWKPKALARLGLPDNFKWTDDLNIAAPEAIQAMRDLYFAIKNKRLPPPPPHGDRDGATFESNIDAVRLNQQADDVWRAMHDGRKHTLADLSQTTGHPEASISARIRDFRKEKFGSHLVYSERVPGGNGLHCYWLVPNPNVNMDSAV